MTTISQKKPRLNNQCIELLLFTMLDTYLLAQSKGHTHQRYREPFQYEYKILEKYIPRTALRGRPKRITEPYNHYTQLYNELKDEKNLLS